MRVFVTHNPEDLDAYYARSLPDLRAIAEVTLNPLDRDLESGELAEAAAHHDVIIAHRSTPADALLFETLPDLLALLRCAIDVSTIDVDAASQHGILVANADKSFIASTAELAIGLLLDVARNISASACDYRAGVEPPQRPGWQISGLTAGIIGYGSIGAYLAVTLRALGMTVLVNDHDPDVGVGDDITPASLGELLSASDVVFPLTPGGSETAGLIGVDQLATMKPGAALINVSRGEVLDEGAVLDALDSGRLSGLGIDVGQSHDQRPSAALAAHPLVVATPHLGGLTAANADAQADSSVKQVAAMIAHDAPPRSLNFDDAHRLRAWWNQEQSPDEQRNPS
ncbi:MAG: NAD(P)-dependent oxidoreductase [Acidimicrobiales bacterium]